MRLLKRNCTTAEWIPYDSVGDDLDEFGRHTGEPKPTYGSPVTLERVNISTPSGRVNQTFYGQDVRYTHTMLLERTVNGMTEHDRIRWKDELYEIMAVRPSLNVTAVAMRKLTVNHAESGPDES